MIHPETIVTYDAHAQELAAYFAGIGSRADLIEKGLELAGGPQQARAVEIGCGDGRDAEDIIARVGWYEGFDPSVGLIDLAHKRLPGANFQVADALSYAYPGHLDVVYAFASLLHLDRSDFSLACDKARRALRVGGVLLMTLKERETYQEELVADEFGERMFYYYDESTIREQVGDVFEVAYLEHAQLKRKTAQWLYAGLRKIC